MNPIFYFLVALTAVLAVTTNAQPVLDTDGDVIFSGSYYVVPRIFGAGGGGLTLTSPGGGNHCPLYIGQEDSEVNRGIPVRFSDWMPKIAVVLESVNLNIEMDVAATICFGSTYWNVAGPDIVMKEVLIPAGPRPSNGLFQIKKIEDGIGGYKIVYCPNESNCSDIGIFVDKEGVRRLALSSTPFEVVFVKATETKTSSKTMSII